MAMVKLFLVANRPPVNFCSSTRRPNLDNGVLPTINAALSVFLSTSSNQQHEKGSKIIHFMTYTDLAFIYAAHGVPPLSSSIRSLCQILRHRRGVHHSTCMRATFAITHGKCNRASGCKAYSAFDFDIVSHLTSYPIVHLYFTTAAVSRSSSPPDEMHRI
jgi:hypothetical protein